MIKMSTGSIEASPSPSPGYSAALNINAGIPKIGTLVPNRVFVGGISSNTTESELHQLFSEFGNVKQTKIIADRAGVSKGYGFVTFETEEEARRLQAASEDIILKERKLNIAPAIKKQQAYGRSYEMGQPVVNGAIYYHNGIPYTYQQNGVAVFVSDGQPCVGGVVSPTTGKGASPPFSLVYPGSGGTMFLPSHAPAIPSHHQIQFQAANALREAVQSQQAGSGATPGVASGAAGWRWISPGSTTAGSTATCQQPATAATSPLQSTPPNTLNHQINYTQEPGSSDSSAPTNLPTNSPNNQPTYSLDQRTNQQTFSFNQPTFQPTDNAPHQFHSVPSVAGPQPLVNIIPRTPSQVVPPAKMVPTPEELEDKSPIPAYNYAYTYQSYPLQNPGSGTIYYAPVFYPNPAPQEELTQDSGKVEERRGCQSGSTVHNNDKIRLMSESSDNPVSAPLIPYTPTTTNVPVLSSYIPGPNYPPTNVFSCPSPAPCNPTYPTTVTNIAPYPHIYRTQATTPSYSLTPNYTPNSFPGEFYYTNYPAAAGQQIFFPSHGNPPNTPITPSVEPNQGSKYGCIVPQTPNTMTNAQFFNYAHQSPGYQGAVPRSSERSDAGTGDDKSFTKDKENSGGMVIPKEQADQQEKSRGVLFNSPFKRFTIFEGTPAINRFPLQKVPYRLPRRTFVAPPRSGHAYRPRQNLPPRHAAASSPRIHQRPRKNSDSKAGFYKAGDRWGQKSQEGDGVVPKTPPPNPALLSAEPDLLQGKMKRLDIL